jgi:RNA polymerase sigma factor (sigma-70 family)
MPLLQVCLSKQSHEHWSELVDRLQPVIAVSGSRVFARYCRFRPEPDLVDDLTQQTFVRLWSDDCRALRKMAHQDEKAFLAYVRTVAENVTIDHLRKKTPECEPLDLEAPDGSPPPQDRTDFHRDVDRHLTACAGKDAPRDRLVFWLYYRTGLAAQEIAALRSTKLTQKGVEALLLRLTRCIRRSIAEGIRGKNTFHREGGGNGTDE